LHFGKAIGSAHIRDFSTSEKELEILKSLRQQIVETGNQSSAKQVMVQIKITEGLLLFLNDKQEKGIALLQEAVFMEDDVGKHGITPGKLTPAREFLADMLMDMNKPNDALLVYEKNLIVNPNRFNGVYGAAMASKISGDEKKAASYFNKLIKLTENANSDRPELKEAVKYLANNPTSI